MLPLCRWGYIVPDQSAAVIYGLIYVSCITVSSSAFAVPFPLTHKINLFLWHEPSSSIFLPHVGLHPFFCFPLVQDPVGGSGK